VYPAELYHAQPTKVPHRHYLGTLPFATLLDTTSQFRVTTTLRHPEFPAASYARIVTTFEPTSNGIDDDQFVVPLAVPDCPMFVDHLTDVTPTLSLAVPLNAIKAEEVDAVVAPGDATVTVGGVVSVPDPPPPVGGAVACLVTVTTCDT